MPSFFYRKNKIMTVKDFRFTSSIPGFQDYSRTYIISEELDFSQNNLNLESGEIAKVFNVDADCIIKIFIKIVTENSAVGVLDVGIGDDKNGYNSKSLISGCSLNHTDHYITNSRPIASTKDSQIVIKNNSDTVLDSGKIIIFAQVTELI